MASLLHRAARRLVRRPLALYDRLLGGRAFPGAEAVDRQVARLQTWAGGGTVPLSKERWDQEYDGGVWDYLADEQEAARYRAILELIDGSRPASPPGESDPDRRRLDRERGAILDVGCGEGVLVDFLRAAGGGEGLRYTGLDLSERAIETARRKRGDDGTRFEVADAETWTPEPAPPGREDRAAGSDPEGFDAIVLNECLYYFHEPLETLRRYLNALVPGGVVVVSMYEAPRTIALARALDRQFPPVRTVRLAGPPGTWRISVHRGAD